MKALEELIEMSKYAGERFDLVQAAGGNTSVKLDSGKMLIKASGFTLSEVTQNSGFSTVLTQHIADIVRNEKIIGITEKRSREKATSKLVKDATIDKANRPSIETLLHSLLYTYTLHTHPIVVNMIVSQKNYIELLNKIFDTIEIVIVKYETPGIELAIQLDRELQKFEDIPKIIFLQNHGLIITSDSKDEIKTLNELVISKIENHLNVNLDKYKLTNSISEILNSIESSTNISYLSDDSFLNETLKDNKDLLFKAPFCPDTLVYCDFRSVEIDNLSDRKAILAYKQKYHSLPKIVIYKHHIFFIGSSIKKAKEIEEVFKFHIIVLENNQNKNINYLNLNELAYLSNWEAEKYRQDI